MTKFSLLPIDDAYLDYNNQLIKTHTEIAQCRGNAWYGCVVIVGEYRVESEISGRGNVKSQSLKKGEKFMKGATLF